MNTQNQAYEPGNDAKNVPVKRTMRLQVAITEPDLENAILRAFHLAKSGGMELDLAFSPHSRAQRSPNLAGIRAAHSAR